VFNIAHWLRDNRLNFKSTSVLISPSPCDNYQGSQPILPDNGTYDVIIVGAGMSGCSAAFYITQQRPGTRILILDGQPTPGGNANRDDAPPIPDIASTATATLFNPMRRFSTTSTARPAFFGRTM
jgi:NAD(P)-binding Rossmann-like domain